MSDFRLFSETVKRKGARLLGFSFSGKSEKNDLHVYIIAKEHCQVLLEELLRFLQQGAARSSKFIIV